MSNEEEELSFMERMVLDEKERSVV